MKNTIENKLKFYGLFIGQEVYSDTKKYTWDGEKWKLSPIVVD